MTETDEITDLQQPEAEPWDAIDALTLAELDSGSRLLKTSIIRAVAEKTEDYERGLAIVAYLHARRTDRETKPDELLRRFTGMRYSEVADHLASLAPDADPAGPTAPGHA